MKDKVKFVVFHRSVWSCNMMVEYSDRSFMHDDGYVIMFLTFSR